MKLMYKYRHYIAAVLTVTVSIMLMATSVSAKPETVGDSKFTHHCREKIGSFTPYIEVDGSTPIMGSSGYVQNEYDSKTTYFYFTSQATWNTIYWYGDFHGTDDNIEQYYGITGKFYLPNFCTEFYVRLEYFDKNNQIIQHQFFSMFPQDQLNLNAHKVSESSSSMWTANNWYNSINGFYEIEYYTFEVNNTQKVPAGASSVRMQLYFYNDSYTNLMFAIDDAYIHHQCNSSKDKVYDTEYEKFLADYADIMEDVAYHTNITNMLQSFFEKLGLSKVFGFFDGITTFVTFTTTLLFDMFFITLNPILDEMVTDITESFKPVLESIFANSGVFIKAISPLLSNIINKINAKIEEINDYITEAFTSFYTTYLGPSLNSIIDNTSGGYSSLMENLDKNLKIIVDKLLVPPEDSEYVVEFEEQKTKLANKLPFIGQIESFFSALLNEDNYSEPAEPVGSYNVEVAKFTAVEIYNMYPHVFYVDNSYLGLANVSLKYLRYTLPYEFEPGKEYCIKASTVQTTAMNAFTVINAEGKYKDCNNQEGYTGNLQELLILARDDVNIINIVVYEVTEPDVGWSFNVLGTSVNIFDFSWYLPYKAFGDSVILSFVYLSFGWRLYKRLFALI